MAETKTFQGSCHCGQVRYEVALKPLEEVMECNCSLCSRKGAKMTFVPAGAFKLLSGEGVLKDYQFGKKGLHHLFCSNCGIHSFAKGVGRDGGEQRMINVRCLDGIDYGALKVVHVDGKSR